MYAPPLVVDVTWWVERKPEDPQVPLREPIRAHVLRLYSMLRRHVDPEDPKKSAGEIVVRPGVGIPVQLGRPLDRIIAEIDEERARKRDARTRRAVVLLLDAQTYDSGQGAVRQAVKQLLRLAAQDSQHVRLLPVTLDTRWDGDFAAAGPVRLAYIPEDKRVARAALSVGTNLARWLMPRRADAADAPHVRIFVSHAKVDTEATSSAADVLNKHLQQDTELKTFFDAQQIERGAPIAPQLEAAQREAVLLSLRTDHYAESAWCHEEVLTAKALQVPVLTVWSVRKEERRALPYGGNTPTLVWDVTRLDEIAERALQAWLHHLHFHLQAPTALGLADITADRAFISRPPELVDFALGALPVDREAVVLYPDPPLPTAETRVLRLAHPRVRLATPSTLFGGAVLSSDPAPPLADRTIALSLADSPSASAAGEGANWDGYNALHVEDVTSYLTLCVVRAGARIAYGGHLRKGGFTPFLADIIAQHNTIGAGFAPVPLVYLAGHLKREESAIRVERHGVMDDDIVIDTSDELLRKVGEALQLRAMRIRMAVECDARIAIGGKDRGYAGRFPGVVEECWRMLEANKPIYPLGGFGGAAKLVASALLGEVPPELRETEMRTAGGDFDSFCQSYDADPRRKDARGDASRAPDPSSLDELAVRIATFSELLRSREQDAVWTNGLTVAENLRLFVTRDLIEIAHLVMKGLATVLKREPGSARDHDRAVVRLFNGNILDLDAAEAYAVPVINGLAPTGCARAMDDRLGGRIRDRLQRPIHDVERLDAGGARLAGRTVLLVPLGKDQHVFRAPGECIEEAYRALARYMDTHDIKGVAIVPFGGTIGLPASASVTRLLEVVQEQLAYAPITLTICELDPDRYAAVKRGLGVAFTELAPPAISSSLPSSGHRTPIVVSARRDRDDITISVLPPSDDTDAVVEQVTRTFTPDDRGRIDVYARIGLAPTVDKLDRAGTELATRLFSETQLRLLAKHAERPLDVVHDLTTAAIPWELLAYDKDGQPWFPAREAGMRRRLVVDGGRIHLRPRRLELGEKLRVLLVVAPRGLPAAKREAASIIAGFRSTTRVDLHPLEDDKATVKNVIAALEQRWDVLHYAGHAQFDARDRANSGLDLVDGRLTAERLTASGSGSLVVPPLVVLNACTSGRVRADEEARNDEAPIAPGLAEAILVAGARTFIGTFWRVYDRAAAKFAETLYHRLLGGETVGGAVLAARRALAYADDPEPDWVNYNLYGDTELRW